ncbi:hypothetical protein ACJIZ3_025832 [Penstemon smallii]|uniref:Uncharacterized protein n=1 Tax=Penstemon smallii TaxID=265156 RepID=A0ABD3TX13_9LAMI
MCRRKVLGYLTPTNSNFSLMFTKVLLFRSAYARQRLRNVRKSLLRLLRRCHLNCAGRQHQYGSGCSNSGSSYWLERCKASKIKRNYSCVSFGYLMVVISSKAFYQALGGRYTME